MTIYQLFEREDIYSIIEITLKEYFFDVHGINTDVRLTNNKFRNHFVVYPRIGIIISRVPTWEVMKHVYADFNVQGSTLRKIIAWGYITLCWCTFGLMGSRTLYVSSKKALHRNISIMACNRKIRIFDFKNRFVDAIIKVGYHDYYFKNEIKARTTLNYPFIPCIDKIGPRWYREKILDGSGLVRTAPGKYEKYCNEVLSDIRKLYIDYGSSITLSDYANRLDETLRKGIKQLHINKGITDLTYLESIKNKTLDLLRNDDMSVPITLSHGDLQTGNIIVDEKQDKVTIYDWETFGERSVWFDCSRLLLYSVRRENFIHMVNQYEDKEIKDSLLILDNNKNRNMKQVVAVLVLEDMIFRIDEVVDLPGKIGTEGIIHLENTLKEITWLN